MRQSIPRRRIVQILEEASASSSNRVRCPFPCTVSLPLSLPTLVNLTTAGLGGISGWIVVHPFNTFAVRMSLRSASVSVAGAKAVKEQGVMNLLVLWTERGDIKTVLYATSRFGLLEVFRIEMSKYRPTDMRSRLHVWTGMLSTHPQRRGMYKEELRRSTVTPQVRSALTIELK